MAGSLGDDGETRLSVAALFAAWAKTMDETDPSFSVRFKAHLGQIHNNMRDAESQPTGALETLLWTRELIDE